MTSRGRGNVGLGLFIVSEVVRAHGGTISVHSADDGTIFSISLPFDADASSSVRAVGAPLSPAPVSELAQAIIPATP